MIKNFRREITDSSFARAFDKYLSERILNNNGEDTDETDKGLKLLNSSEQQQLYICALGINDYYHLGESYLGTIADIQTKVDTFYGNYAKIIEAIKQKSPNAKIIMLTTTGYHSVTMKFNKAITDIVNYNNLQYQ